MTCDSSSSSAWICSSLTAKNPLLLLQHRHTRIITTTMVIQMRTRMQMSTDSIMTAVLVVDLPLTAVEQLLWWLYFSLYTYGLLNFRYKHNTGTTNYYNYDLLSSSMIELSAVIGLICTLLTAREWERVGLKLSVGSNTSSSIIVTLTSNHWWLPKERMREEQRKELHNHFQLHEN